MAISLGARTSVSSTRVKRKAVKNLDKYVEKGQIEILDYSEWYTKSGEFDADRVLQDWVDKEKSALGKGFDGLRLTGNTSWLERRDWDAFVEYENKIDNVIDSYRMLAVCTYALEKCSSSDILDVVTSHRFSLVRKEGRWQVIKTAEQERLQTELDSEVQNFRNSMDNSPLGIRVVTEEGELLYANKAILDIYGYSSFEELKNTPAKQRYTPESYAEHEERKEKRKRGEFVPSNYKISIVGKDDKIRHLEVFRKEIIWNSERQYQALYLDITERKQVEEEIAKLAKFPAENPSPVLRIDKEGNILYANQASLNLLNKWGSKTGEQAPKYWRKLILNALNSGSEIVAELKVGQGLFTWTFVPVVDAGYVNIYGLDITEKKQAEKREAQLQQEIIISSRLASVGEMAAGIAHEINNPLTGVIGFASLLLKKDLPKDIREMVDVVYEGSQRVANITNGMLSYARQHKPERGSININAIIETTFDMQAYKIKASNIKITTRLDPDLPTTIADAGQLQQVFLNIILNAETEMINAHGGGTLSIKTERIDDTIQVSFKDDGPGIPRKNIERIFDPFFTTREVGQGTGLGLSVCYGIVKQHDGKIYARSRLGKGATFFVELPVVTEEKQLKMAEPAAEVPKTLSRARILVVDDDTFVQKFLTEILGKEGHEVEIVENGDDALGRLGSEDYGVILLDVKLPGMTGIELYGYMQKMDKSLLRRVIFITGDVMSADTMVFIKSTGIPYITKPFDIEQLKKSISRIISEQS